MDRVNALRNAQAIARNQQLVGDEQWDKSLGESPTRLRTEDMTDKSDIPRGGFTPIWNSESVNDPYERNVMNSAFRNSIMNADKAGVRPDMDEVMYGEGYANYEGNGRDLTTGSWGQTRDLGHYAESLPLNDKSARLDALRRIQNNMRYAK